MMKQLIPVAAVCLLSGPVTATAQVYSVPRHLPTAQRYFYGDDDPIENLTKLLESGQREELNTAAIRLLEKLAENPTIKAQLGEVSRNYYHLIWISTNSDGKDVLNRVLVYKEWDPTQGARLPGLRSRHSEKPQPGDVEVRDVLLTPAAHATLDSIWVFTPVANPLATQLPDVISKIDPLAMLGKALGAADEGSSILVYVNKPDIVRSRATIAIKDTVTTLSSVSDLEKTLKDRAASLRLRQARGSSCALEFTTRLETAASKALAGPSCQLDTTKQPGGECGKAVKSALQKVMPAFAEDAGMKPVCAAEPWWAAGPDRLAPIEQEFFKLVAEAAPTVVKGESTLSNTPMTQWSFGLMSGVYLGTLSRKEPRVTIEDGKYKAAPMDRLMTMVIVNYHPTPFNSEWPEVSFAERFRWFSGVVLTPDLGFTAGGGIGAVRGLSINLGAVWVWGDTAEGGVEIGGPPTDKNNPFRKKVGFAGFIGLGYAFK